MTSQELLQSIARKNERAEKLTNHELAHVVQNTTNFPWFNGEAYVENKGWYALAIKAHEALGEIDKIIEQHRAAGRYEESDALRAAVEPLRHAARYVMSVEKVAS